MSRASSSSISPMQILLAIVMLIIAGVVAAFLFAPQKPEAPENSIVRPEAPPGQERAQREAGAGSEAPLEAARPKARPRTVQEVMARADDVEQPATEGRFIVSGSVVDSRTGKPVPGAGIEFEREVAAAEETDLRTRIQAALDAGDESAMQELEKESARIHHVKSITTNDDGTFEVRLGEPGSYNALARVRGYISKSERVGPLGDETPNTQVAFRLSTGASISGRVTEAGNSAPAAGVHVTIEGRGQDAITDEQGNYTLTGLEPGEIGVSVDIARSPYRMGKVIPYQKVTVTNPEQEVKSINFTVEPAGTVWGYVMTAQNEPVKDAQVILSTGQSLITQALSSMLNQAPPLGSGTDKEGYYELVGVPLNEEWRVYATSEKASPQLADAFVLTAAQRSMRVDVFMFAGSTVSGFVKDTRGEFIPEASVMCIPAYSQLLGPMDTPQAIRQTRSEKDGAYSIADLPPGDYQLFTQKKGYKLSAVGEPIHPDGYSNITSFDLLLESVDEGEYSISGRIITVAGEGIGAADIHVEGVGASFSGIQRDTVSDGSGGFRIDGVESGMYSLRVSKEGYATKSVTRILLDKPNEVILARAATVRGRVLVRETNAPPLTYTVSAVPLSASGSPDPMRMLDPGEDNSRSFSNPDGTFELALNEGNYRLEAKSEPLTPGRTEVSVEPGELQENVVIYVSEEGGRIAGTVVTGDRGNAQGAEVVLIEAATSAEATILLASEDPNLRRTQIGEDGSFSFTGLPAGIYIAIARHPSYANGESEVIDLPEGEAQENVTIRLGSGGALEGYVFAQGKPSPSAMVIILGNGTTQSGTTDATGYYFVDGLASGTYQAMVSQSSGSGIGDMYGTQGVSVTVEEGVTTRQDFGMGEGITIEGVCSPPPSTMLGGRAVLRQPGPGIVALGELADISQLLGQSIGIDPAGGFVLEGVMPGEWQIDIFFFEFGGVNPLQVRYAHTELISITGEEPVVPVEIAVAVP